MVKLIDFSDSLSSGSDELLEELRMEMKGLITKNIDEALRVEYAHLFLMPEGVKAYESVYRRNDGLMMQEPWEKVRAFYLKHGLKIEGDKSHPEDHASVELAFMAILIENEETEAVQKVFFDQHLSCWLPKLFSDIEKNPYANFYQMVAKYGEDFLRQEKTRFIS